MSEEKKEPEKSGMKQGRDKEGRFLEGVSGNPAGRPEGTKNFSTLFKKAIEKIAKEDETTELDAEKELVLKAYREAKKGNFNFYRDLMDRNYGRPKETHEIGGIEGKPIPILYVCSDPSNKKDSETNEED